jgi:hypothetical protein
LKNHKKEIFLAEKARSQDKSAANDMITQVTRFSLMKCMCYRPPAIAAARPPPPAPPPTSPAVRSSTPCARRRHRPHHDPYGGGAGGPRRAEPAAGDDRFWMRLCHDLLALLAHLAAGGQSARHGQATG